MESSCDLGGPDARLTELDSKDGFPVAEYIAIDVDLDADAGFAGVTRVPSAMVKLEGGAAAAFVAITSVDVGELLLIAVAITVVGAGAGDLLLPLLFFA